MKATLFEKAIEISDAASKEYKKYEDKNAIFAVGILAGIALKHSFSKKEVNEMKKMFGLS